MREAGRGERAGEIERVYHSRYGAFLHVAAAVFHGEQLAEETVHNGFVRALRHRRTRRAPIALRSLAEADPRR
jgi:DNA-directed RNA polymerase specialized sigma24 family protein